MNPLILIAGGALSMLIGIIELNKKETQEKVLTENKKPDTVESSIANSVPNQDESEADSNDDSDQPDSGESV